MTELVVPEPTWQKACETLSHEGLESAGAFFASRLDADGVSRLVVHDIRIASAEEYIERSSSSAILTPTFVAEAAKRARDNDETVILFHTHPFSDSPVFSAVDSAGEGAIRSFLARRTPERRHYALVLGRVGAQARELGKRDLIAIRIVGPTVTFISVAGPESSENARMDRQVRAFGAEGQRRIEALRIAIIGLGGTGSLTAEWLTHLGVKNFLLIDPDVLIESNLNRVVGATHRDVGVAKVRVARRNIRRINPKAKVQAISEDVTREPSARRLITCDVIFSCTDSHGSRSIINQVAYQFLIPTIDVGVVIAVSGSRITHIAGRAQMLSPGLPCLTCLGTLDPEQVRRDLLSEFERNADPYVIGTAAPIQPAVVSLNATAASLGVSMFLSAFTGLPLLARHQMYDAMKGTVRAVAGIAGDQCVVCSLSGALGQGTRWPVPGRTA